MERLLGVKSIVYFMMRRSWRIVSENSSYLTLQLEKEIEIEVLIFLLAISPQKAACTDTCSPSLISRHHCTTQWSLMFGLSSLTCWVFTQEGSPTNPKIFLPWYYFLQLKRAWWYLWNCIEFEESIAPCRVWLKDDQWIDCDIESKCSCWNMITP